MSRPNLENAAAYDYDLPESLIAQRPAPQRDRSRLMVLRRDAPADQPAEDREFRDIVDLIPAGDALVLNETRVIPARLLGRKPTGAPAEILLLRPLSKDERQWEALVRPGSKLKPGRVVDVEPDLRVHIEDSLPGGGRVVRLESDVEPRRAIERAGAMPLPPYIQREAGPEDRDRYQTVFAREPGSVAAPTAGLHFTATVLDTLREKGVHIVHVVLHVGMGTFRPVDEDDLARHRMHSEWYQVPQAAAETLSQVRQSGGAIWAVGTTVTRTLESVAQPDGSVAAGSGWTDIFIRPPYRFRAVDRLVTNFHLPKSTLLMLVSAFAGYERTMAAYRDAVAQRYRFYSYGDAMVII